MRGFLNVLFLTLIVIVSFVVFFPKEKLYSLAQEKLKDYSVAIETKSVNSEMFSLELLELEAFLSGSRVASVGDASFGLFSVRLNDVRAMGSFADMMPVISVVDARIGFGEIARASGNFGEVVACVLWSEKKIILEAFISDSIKNKYKIIFAKFKKEGDKYIYEIHL